VDAGRTQCVRAQASVDSVPIQSSTHSLEVIERVIDASPAVSVDGL